MDTLKALRSRPRTLPLGVDIGTARIRVALVHRNLEGETELVAVATRARGDDAATALADAVAELQTSERRCVFGLGEPRALLRTRSFPVMRPSERERAARFEAAGLIDYPIREANVRVIPLGTSGDALIGVVRKDVMSSLVTLARAAKLRITAVDNDAFALRRAVAAADAVLDIGLDDSRLHIFTGGFPSGRRFSTGGAAFTAAVAQALGADDVTAERRKRTYGIAGCGETESANLIADVANALVDFRAGGYGDVRNIALVGNGSRLNELAALIERATAVAVAPATLHPDVSRTLPPDVLRAAAPDWCLAYGLALWAAA